MTKQQRTIQALSRLEVIQPGSGNHPVDFGCVPVACNIQGTHCMYIPGDDLTPSQVETAWAYIRDVNLHGSDLDFEWTGEWCPSI